MCRCQGVFLAIIAPGVEQLFGKSIVSAATGTHISVLCAENMAREGSFQWVSKTWEVVDAHPDLAYWDKVSRSHNLKQCATSGYLFGTVCFEKARRGKVVALQDRPSALLRHPRLPKRRRVSKKTAQQAGMKRTRPPHQCSITNLESCCLAMPEVTRMYDLQRICGQGSEGVAWEAQDRKSLQKVVIKMSTTDPSWASKEFQRLVQIRHPNIPEALGFMVSVNAGANAKCTSAIIMELGLCNLSDVLVMVKHQHRMTGSERMS